MIQLLLMTLVALPTASELLDRSIEYHDPEGVWLRSEIEMEIISALGSSGMRVRECVIDYRDYSFHMKQISSAATIERWVEDGECRYAIDGREPTNEEMDQHRLDCDRNILYRDYISYLWGLPMKLQDPGTRLEPEVTEGEFDEQAVWTLTIRYDAEVGSDTYLVHFDPETARMVGYEFYHAEPGDGEYITLEGEMEIGGVKIPKTRDWYRSNGDEYLGQDDLRKAEIVSADS